MTAPPLPPREEPLKCDDVVLDRYRVEERLTAGGHSVVYRGVDERLERPVCIKAFHGLAEDQGILATVLEHFIQEAFALSKLTHPNTLRIYDFGHLQLAGELGVPVQVSEYMGGGTLGSIVRAEGPLPADEALAIICKLGDALSEAHRNGIVHRDIKPQNILFTGGPGREPKLADFGIAKSAMIGNVHNQANETRVIAGFPLAMYSRSWAAPEQLSGEEATVSADIFSLALVAIFALTGKAICTAASAREGYELRRDLSGAVKDSFAGLAISPQIVNVLDRACRFDKKARPGSVEEFVRTLREAHEAPLPASAHSPAAGPHTTSRAGSAPLHLHRKGSAWQVAQFQAHAEGTDTTGVITVPDEKRVAEAINPAPSLALRAAPSHRGPSIALSRRHPKQVVGSRACEFIELGEGAVLLHIGATRVQINTTPNPLIPSGQSLTFQGLTCFVAKAGGRPSRAVVISGDEYIDLIDPRQQLLGRIRVSFGARQADRYHFQLGNSPIDVDAGECPNPILIDCPTHHQSYLLYGVNQSTPGRVTQR